MRYQEMKKLLVNLLSELCCNVKNHLIKSYNNIVFNLTTIIAYSAYLRLMRLDKPKAWLLIGLPTWWTILLSTNNYYEILKHFIIFALGALVMRSAGCIVNDIIDYKTDSKVERTKNRPIASGELSLIKAIILLAFLLSIALLLLFLLPIRVFNIGLFGLIGVILYPMTKYFTYFPQVILGFVFNLGVLIAWYSINNFTTFTPILLYLGAILWTIGYDTIYGHQDSADDLKVGVKSLSLKLGKDTPSVVWKLYKVACISIWLAGFNSHLNLLFSLIMAIATYMLYLQTETVDINNPQDCTKKFNSNTDFAWLIFFGILLGKL